MSQHDIVVGPDSKARCAWGVSTDDYIDYHDNEWGRPVVADNTLFEKLVLEGFQSGLSWLTILRKRPAFRRAFAGFDPAVVAEFGEPEIEALLSDASIVRHRGKIAAAITNARATLNVQRERGSLAAFVWPYAPSAIEFDERPEWQHNVPGLTATSKRLAKDLKVQGFVFVGPTTVYAFMQAMGLVNDHHSACYVHGEVSQQQAAVRAKMKP